MITLRSAIGLARGPDFPSARVDRAATQPASSSGQRGRCFGVGCRFVAKRSPRWRWMNRDRQAEGAWPGALRSSLRTASHAVNERASSLLPVFQCRSFGHGIDVLTETCNRRYLTVLRIDQPPNLVATLYASKRDGKRDLYFHRNCVPAVRLARLPHGPPLCRRILWSGGASDMPKGEHFVLTGCKTADSHRSARDGRIIWYFPSFRAFQNAAWVQR